jgi:hypothetical protein
MPCPVSSCALPSDMLCFRYDEKVFSYRKKHSVLNALLLESGRPFPIGLQRFEAGCLHAADQEQLILRE